MLVFREGRAQVASLPLLTKLAARLSDFARIPDCKDQDAAVDALLRAGELECALEDASSPAAPRMASITSALAEALVHGRVPQNLALPCPGDLPPLLRLSRPEGFAYYALHPLNYADAVPAGELDSEVAVIGIRSIGTTLSAVVAAALHARGLGADRITVRLHGHPFDRRLCFHPAQTRWVAERVRRGARFLVVDEGPGLSGSSFLAVGEALLAAGVTTERIRFLGSAEPDCERLRAPQAAARWRRFRFVRVKPPWRAPEGEDFSYGQWRKWLPEPWPASWLHFERLKFRSRQEARLYKFEGLGRYGAEVIGRAQALHAAGFAPSVDGASDGFAAYSWCAGRPMRPEDASRTALETIARYCAWRASAFPAAATEDLADMLRVNVREEFGTDWSGEAPLPVKPVVTDGRMHPHEWLLGPEGMIKLDAASHGDDHFLPGPTDIAWDLAGAIVEWQLRPPAAEFLLERYRALTGDDARGRLPGFLLAYTMLHLGYARMAAESLRGTDEERRFQRDAKQYGAIAQAEMERFAGSVESTK